MIILAIETSCDDTCIAVIEADRRGYQRGKTLIQFKILSNIISSQAELHRKYGGVWPFLAKREHQRNLPVVLRKALRKAGFEISLDRAKRGTPRRVAFPGPSEARNSPEGCFLISKKNPNPKVQMPKINLISVTVGPGLEPCLWTGINFARELAKEMKLPLIPVNHIEAHILANWLKPISEVKSQKLKVKSLFPAVCLIVSGGHTQLILMKDFGKYKILGETRDDAAGECFDKTARILGLGYPGGPAIAAEAAKLPITNYQLPINLPRPMIYQKNYDFSFSGLKTAVLYNYKNQPGKIRKSILRQGSGLTLSEIEASKKYIQEMSSEVQQAIIDVLIRKTIRAASEHKAKVVILGGGVSANEELRNQFQIACSKENFRFLAPEPKLCTDNAAMVAAAAYYSWLRGKTKTREKIEANANLRL